MTGKLKADFHLHTSDDKIDRIVHSSEELIDQASRQGYDVLSITNHNDITYTPRLADYAKERGILLIPGCEAKIQKKHVLLYNFKQVYRSFDQVKSYKDKDNLVIAPHPFYPERACLNGALEKNLDIFDALEYCHYYHPWINFNKQAIELSRRKNIPLFGTSDVHLLFQLGATYSMIEAEKDMESIFEAVKSGRVEIFTRPLTFRQMVQIRFGLQLQRIFKFTPRVDFHFPPPVKLQLQVE